MNNRDQKLIKDVFKEVATENNKQDLDFTLDDLYNGLDKLRSKTYMKPFLKVKISTLLTRKKQLKKISDALAIASMFIKPVIAIPSFLVKKLGGEKWTEGKVKRVVIKKLSRIVAEEMYKDKVEQEGKMEQKDKIQE